MTCWTTPFPGSSRCLTLKYRSQLPLPGPRFRSQVIVSSPNFKSSFPGPVVSSRSFPSFKTSFPGRSFLSHFQKFLLSQIIVSSPSSPLFDIQDDHLCWSYFLPEVLAAGVSGGFYVQAVMDVTDFYLGPLTVTEDGDTVDDGAARRREMLDNFVFPVDESNLTIFAETGASSRDQKSINGGRSSIDWLSHQLRYVHCLEKTGRRGGEKLRTVVVTFDMDHGTATAPRFWVRPQWRPAAGSSRSESVGGSSAAGGGYDDENILDKHPANSHEHLPPDEEDLHQDEELRSQQASIEDRADGLLLGQLNSPI